jgi:hypothetical protein
VFGRISRKWQITGSVNLIMENKTENGSFRSRIDKISTLDNGKLIGSMELVIILMEKKFIEKDYLLLMEN